MTCFQSELLPKPDNSSLQCYFPSICESYAILTMSEINHQNRIYFAVASSIINIVTIIGNILIIIAFIKVRSLRRKPSNALILALSITDLLFGIYELVFYAVPYYFYNGNPFGKSGCIVTVAFNNLYPISNLLLVAISIDRVLLVSLPYPKYVKTLTLFRVRMAVLACYLIGLVTAVIELSIWNLAIRKSAEEINSAIFCKSPARHLEWFASIYFVALGFGPVFLIGILSAVFVCLLFRRIKTARRVGDLPSYSTSNAVNAVSSLGPLFLARQSLSRGEALVETLIRNRYIKPAVTLFVLVAAMCISMLPLCTFVLLGYSVINATW